MVTFGFDEFSFYVMVRYACFFAKFRFVFNCG